jgi:hypothetical protein
MAFLEYSPKQTLFQFCSLESFRRIITSKAIWCTDLDAANDPRELALGFKHFVDALEFVRENEYHGKVGDFLATIRDSLMASHRRQQFFCACFSLLADALPMWREYGDDLRGIAIGFRPTAITSLPGRIQKVKYLNPDTPEEFRQLIRDLAANFDPDHSPSDITYWTAANSMVLAAATALKHHSWEYEKEIRFVFAQVRVDPGSMPVSYHDDGTLVFWEKPLSRSRGPETVAFKAFPFGLRKNNSYDSCRAIARVLLGPRCEASTADIEAELKSSGFDGVEVARSECQIR